eukprot:2151947-Rhodomonas_salina.1
MRGGRTVYEWTLGFSVRSLVSSSGSGSPSHLIMPGSTNTTRDMQMSANMTEIPKTTTMVLSSSTGSVRPTPIPPSTTVTVARMPGPRNRTEYFGFERTGGPRT